MKPVDQTTFGDGSDGTECGNCFAACIASLLELPIDQVPNFAAAGDDSRWLRACNRWLNERGIGYADLTWEGAAPDFVFELWIAPAQLYIAGGLSERGLQHCVVMRGDRELVHDPHPSRAGILKVEAIGLLMPLNPVRGAVRCQTCGAPVTVDRFCYVIPTCHACLPPPRIEAKQPLEGHERECRAGGEA